MTAVQPVPDPLNLSGRRLDGRYDIAEKIGEGGMAVVYRATDRAGGDTVAIKVLLPGLIRDTTSMARLRLEADVGTQLRHPNLCSILAFRESPELTYIVMTLLDGEALFDRVARLGELPVDATARIVRDVAAGLHAAHELGVIHRDLKPENVMLVPDASGTERAVLLDFGLAAVRRLTPAARKLTQTGMVVGTPDFMSPEQMCGKPLDRRSDIYSLAFIAYELLTGRSPFPGKTLREMAVARMRGDLIPIRLQRDDLRIPVEVEQVIARALAVDPDRRYATATEFGEAFARAAGVTAP
ncbi:MAG: serine/threonine-protein kinase [Gemmatimonadales bacterium]